MNKQNMKTKTLIMLKHFTKSLFIASAILIAASASNPISARHEDGEGGVTNAEVKVYLESYGYSVLTIETMNPSADRLAETPATNIRVYVESGSIVGHENIDF